tara:strand:- start:408 stop:665 length:258 start_codon:yes stop_codon:yes gene_type:complete
VDEFAEEVLYFDGSTSTTVTVQFFDQESDVADVSMRKLVCAFSDLPNLSTSGYFLINTIKYGVLDFMPDEENVMMQVILQEGMRV